MQKESNGNHEFLVSQLTEARAVIDRCISLLSRTRKQKHKISSRLLKAKRFSKQNYGLNERNFIRTYANRLSGPKKFTLLLAFITKGKVGVDVELEKIRSRWNKMTAKNLMGYGFNRKYSNEAKTKGWIDSKKQGIYHLRESWMEIFK